MDLFKFLNHLLEPLPTLYPRRMAMYVDVDYPSLNKAKLWNWYPLGLIHEFFEWLDDM